MMNFGGVLDGASGFILSYYFTFLGRKAVVLLQCFIVLDNPNLLSSSDDFLSSFEGVVNLLLTLNFVVLRKLVVKLASESNFLNKLEQEPLKNSSPLFSSPCPLTFGGKYGLNLALFVAEGPVFPDKNGLSGFEVAFLKVGLSLSSCLY